MEFERILSLKVARTMSVDASPINQSVWVLNNAPLATLVVTLVFNGAVTL